LGLLLSDRADLAPTEAYPAVLGTARGTDMMPDDEKARLLERALLNIVRACEGGTRIRSQNWESGIGKIAQDALEGVGVNWRYEILSL